MAVLHRSDDEPVEAHAEASAEELRGAVVLGQDRTVELHLVVAVQTELADGEQVVAPRSEGAADPAAHEEREEGVEGADVGTRGGRGVGSGDEDDGTKIC